MADRIFLKNFLNDLAVKIEEKSINEEELLTVKKFFLDINLRNIPDEDLTKCLFLGFWIKFFPNFNINE